MNLFRVLIELVAKDRASAVVGKATDAIQKAGSAAVQSAAHFRNLAGAFTSLVVAGKIRTLFTSIIAPAAKMESSMMRLGWLTNKTSANLAAMRAAAEKAAERSTIGPLEAVDAMGQLVRATGSAEIAMKGLSVAAGLKMAAFGKLSMDKSTKMISDMAKSFSMSGDEIAVAGDKLMAVTKSVGVGIEELKDVMGYLGTAAIRGGQNFDEMLKSFSLARRVLPSSRRAATQLMRVMGEMTSTKAVNAMQKINIQMMDAAGYIRPMSDIMLDLSEASTQMPLQVRDALNEAFGQAAVKPMFAMLAQLSNGMKTMTGDVVYGADVFKYLDEQIRTSTGAVDEASEVYMQTAAAGIERMSEAWETFKTHLGDAVLPQIGEFAKVLADGLGSLVKLGQALPGPVKWLLKMGAVLTVISAGILAVRMAWISMSAIYKAAIAYTSQVVLQTEALAVASDSAAGATRRLASAQSAATSTSLGMAAAQRTATATTAGAGAASLAGGAIAATKAVGKLKGALGVLGGFIRTNWLGFVIMLAPTIIDWMGKLYTKYTDYVKKTAAAKLGLHPEQAGGRTAEDMESEFLWRTAFGGAKGDTGKQLATAMKAGTWENAKKMMEPLLTDIVAKGKKTQQVPLGLHGDKPFQLWKANSEEILMAEFKKRWEQTRKLEQLKTQLDTKRQQQQLAVWQKSKDALMMGTKPFEDALTKLEKLTSYEPKDIKTSSIVTVMKYMDAIQRKGIGGRVGRGVALAEGDIKSAKTGQAGVGRFLAIVQRALAGEKMSGTDVMAGLSGMESALMTLQTTRALPVEKVKELKETTINALISQLKGPSREAALNWLRSSGGYSAVAGKGAIGGFSQGAAGFVGGPAAAARQIANMPMNVPYQIGGRTGTGLSHMEPGKAAMVGAEEQFPQYVGAGTATMPMPGGEGTMMQVLGEQQKPFKEAVDKLAAQYEQTKTELERMNTALRSGVKIAPSIEWRQRMKDAFGET